MPPPFRVHDRSSGGCSSFVLGLTWFLRRCLRLACVLDSQRRGEEEAEEE